MDYNNFESIKTITNFNKVVDDDYDGWTHFHNICDLNPSNLEVIKHCVEHGADLNIENKYGSTPFHWICINDTTKEVLEYCLENCVDLNIENDYGNTPFDYLKNNNPSLVPFVEEWLKRKQEATISKVTIPKVIIGGVIIGCIYKFLKR